MKKRKKKREGRKEKSHRLKRRRLLRPRGRVVYCDSPVGAIDLLVGHGLDALEWFV